MGLEEETTLLGEERTPPDRMLLEEEKKKFPDRELTELSKVALETLYSTEDELRQIEVSAREIIRQVNESPFKDHTKEAAELAQLEARAVHLEAMGVDNIYTNNLRSGRRMATRSKRQLLARFETLFRSIDQVFTRIEKASPAAAQDQEGEDLDVVEFKTSDTTKGRTIFCLEDSSEGNQCGLFRWWWWPTHS